MTAAVTEMTVSVKVLVVDGTRRMSHKFYDQIPHRDVVDEDGELVDGAELWGWVNSPDLYDLDIEVVWALDGRLYVARHQRQNHVAAQGWTTEEWNATVDERNAAIDRFNDTVRRLRDELPQLFVGG